MTSGMMIGRGNGRDQFGGQKILTKMQAGAAQLSSARRRKPALFV